MYPTNQKRQMLCIAHHTDPVVIPSNLRLHTDLAPKVEVVNLYCRGLVAHHVAWTWLKGNSTYRATDGIRIQYILEVS